MGLGRASRAAVTSNHETRAPCDRSDNREKGGMLMQDRNARRHLGMLSASRLVIVLALAGCGGGDGATGSQAVQVAPTPSPSPAPAPTPAPSPTPTPAVAVEPYVLGTLRYSLASDIPADKLSAIRDAMEFAVDHSNVLGAFAGTISVVYGATTPTADASYQGQIRFGGSIGRRVALHELAHWLGTGSVGGWSALVTNGRFTGATANARIRAFDGEQAVLNADRMHFWPYGLNYDSEFVDTQRNTQLVSAQRVDLRLGSDETAAIAGLRRFHNRSAQLVLQGAAAGGVPTEDANALGSAKQQWRVTFADGFITLSNADTGLAIEASGSGDNVAATMATANGAIRQQWEMMPLGDGGWFVLRNRATANCLDNVGNLAAGGAVRLSRCGFGADQQWQLVR